MSGTYLVYGLGVHANQHVPGLQYLSPIPRIEVKVWFGSMPNWLTDAFATERIRYVAPYLDERGVPVLRVSELGDGDYFHLRYADTTAFLIDRRGTKVWATWPEWLTLEDAATYLLGPVLGFILRLRGLVCLHASAIAIGGRALVILGPAGAGKSTTAAAYAQLGYKVLSDDIVALDERDGGFLVRPAYPRIRLWPASVEALFGAETALPLLTPTWEKRYLDLTQAGYGFQEHSLPLAAVYVLGERSDDLAAPFVEYITPRDGLMTLVANTYANYLLDRSMRAQEFAVLSRLLECVPLRKVVPHTDPSRLPQLCGTILEDVQKLTTTSPESLNRS